MGVPRPTCFTGMEDYPGGERRRTLPQSSCRSAWARLIAKVYEIDLLVCPRCWCRMRILAVITALNPASLN
jgi:hypothetical protein